MLHTTIQNIVNDNDLITSLYMPAANSILYMIYKGGANIEYYFIYNGNILFAGADYKPSPLDNVDSINSMAALLSFLTVKPDDKGKEYFANYTPEQIAFTATNDCELIALYASDIETGIITGLEYDENTNNYTINQ